MTPAEAIAILDAKLADIKDKINIATSYNNIPISDNIGNPGVRLKEENIKTLHKL